MRKPFSALNSRKKYPVDFALVPIAIVIIEFAVFTTQISSQSAERLDNLILLRLSHTLLMVLISLSVSQTYIQLKRTELNYRTLSLTGILVIAIGDLTHVYLGAAFDIKLVDFNRRIGVILFEGAVWFPAFLIIAGNRKEIFSRFKDYEKRLISVARASSRTSSAYRKVQNEIQDRIRRDLSEACMELKNSVTKLMKSNEQLQQVNQAIAPALLGKDLRKLSVKLQNQQSLSSDYGVRKRLNSISIFTQQFRILYATAIRKSPLTQMAFMAVFVGLVMPLYMYFYSLTEVLIEFPILILALFLITSLITRMQGKGTSLMLNRASILIFLAGLIPLFLDFFGEPFQSANGNHIPLIITAGAFPLTYFISMQLFQVLRPTALLLLQGDDLEASRALQDRVSRTVEHEFSSNLSHQWAVYIHGKILTRLAATSLKLETSSKSGDSKSFYEALDSLISLLDKPDDEFESASTTLEVEINSRLDPWKGLLNISLYIDPELKSLENFRVRDLGEVIEELISNSIRHGKAQNIELRVVRAGLKDVQIASTDDAVIPPPQFPERSGLGTRIFNLASDGRWSINRNGDSTEFRLTMGF